MKFRVLLWISLLVFLLPGFSQASGPVGTITNVKGKVTVVRSGKSLTGRPDMEVLIRDGLRTGKEAYTHIRFSDESTITMAPETEILVADYTVGENRQNSIIEMTIGFMHCRIRKMGAGFFGIKKNRWEIHTETAVVGVRGTDLWTLVGDEAGPTKEKPAECLVKEGQAYGYPTGLPDIEQLNIGIGLSFKTTSANQPGSVGPSSDEMQENVGILSGIRWDEAGVEVTKDGWRKVPPKAEDVTIGEQDFEACDKEIEKAEKAIKEWDAYMYSLFGNIIDLYFEAMGNRATQAHPNSPLNRCNRANEELEDAERERDRWKEKLRQLQAIKRKMQKPKESSGGDGGGNGGHSTNQYEHRDFTGELPGRVAMAMQTDTDWHTSHG